MSEPTFPEDPPPPDTMVATLDDGSGAYMQHRQRFGQASAAEDLMARVARRRQSQAPAEAAPRAEESSGSAMEKVATGIGAAAAVAGDVGRGIVETPRAIVAGALDAVRSTVDLAGEFASWLDETLPTPGIAIDSKGVRVVGPKKLKEVIQKEGNLFQNIPVPELGDPVSVTGKAVEGISQFLTGFVTAGKALKGVKGAANATGLAKWALASAKGAAADFTVFDAHEARLSDLIQSVPELQNPITEYLAADPTDSEAEGRFKNALEGFGLGVAVDGLTLGLKTLRQARIAKAAQNQAANAAALVDEVRPRIELDEFKALGDDDAAAPLIRTIDPSGAKVGDALDQTAGVKPGDVLRETEPKPLWHASGKDRPAPPDNYLTDLGEYAPKMYHETSIESADYLIPGSNSFDSGAADDIFLAESLDTATGQGASKGVTFTIDPKGIQGVRSTKKPSAEFAWKNGVSEFTTRHVTQSQFQESVQAVHISSSAKADKVYGSRLKIAIKRLEDRGWVKTETGDGVTYSRPAAQASVDAGPAPEMFINFARINSPDDVKTVMQDMADKFKPAIDDARRGVQTFKQIELNAEQVNAFDTLMQRRAGSPLNAEQSVAARQLWVSSADRLQSVAKDAAANPSEANLFAFRKMLATHHAIQTEVIAARTETARALASWRIPAGSSAERFRDVTNALEANGGAGLARDMADRIAKLADAGMYSEMDEFVRGSAWAKTKDAMMEAWVMGLLSGPKTHLVNMMSNSSVIGMQMYERATAAQISKLLGNQGGVQVGEATSQLFGIVQGFKDALRYAKKAAMTGETGFGMNKVELPRAGAISSEAFGLSNTGWIGRATDAIGNVVRIPGRALSAEDEFFKTIGYRMELNAQALRQATKDVADGVIQPDALKSRIADILANPPEHVRMSAVDQAAYQTFTNTPGNIAQALSKLTTKYGALKVLIPFVRTPANILKYTFERTALAPLMQHVRADMAAGGARRDLAMARMATGTAIMLTAADMAMSGQISGGGPVNPGQRANLARTGWQPYSVNVDGRWYAYNRMDPLGSLLGMPADMVEILNNSDPDDPNFDSEEAAVAITAAIGANVMNKTYLSGLADFFESMADPKRRAEGFAQRLAGSTVPAVVGEVARGQDPYAREVFTLLDAVKRRTPGMSDELPLRRDLWGRPVEYASGLGWAYDAFSPIYSRKENPEPIDTELLRLEAPIQMPGRRVGFDGIAVDLDRFPGAYSRYLELSGNELKNPAWGLGAKDLLNAIVTGNHPLSQVYELRSDGPDGTKADMIQDLMNQYRELARRQLMDEFPGIRADVNERQAQRRALRMPQ